MTDRAGQQPGPGIPHLDHSLAAYENVDELVDSVGQYLGEAQLHGETVLAMVPNATWKILSNQLELRSTVMEQVSPDSWISAPTLALVHLDRRRRAYFRAPGSARRLRLLTEFVRPGLSLAETREWCELESIIERTFATSPLTLRCLLDTRSVVPEVVEHSKILHSGGDIEDWLYSADPGAQPQRTPGTDPHAER